MEQLMTGYFQQIVELVTLICAFCSAVNFGGSFVLISAISSTSVFVELSGEDSPIGTYIVVGAYSDVKRTENVVKSAKKDYEETRIIFNYRNSLNYVIVKYAVDMYKTMGEVGKSRDLGYDRAWVLDYKKPNRQPANN